MRVHEKCTIPKSDIDAWEVPNGSKGPLHCQNAAEYLYNDLNDELI